MTLLKKAKKMLCVTMAAALAVLVIPVFAGTTNAATMKVVALMKDGTVDTAYADDCYAQSDENVVATIIGHGAETDLSRFSSLVTGNASAKTFTFKNFDEEHYGIKYYGNDEWTFIFDGEICGAEKVTVTPDRSATASLIIDVTEGSSFKSIFHNDGQQTKLTVKDGVEVDGEDLLDGQLRTLTRPKPPVYEFTDGDKQSVEVKSGQSLTFVCNGALGDLKSVIVDDKDITEKGEEAFTLDFGSTKITLKAEFLDTLEGTDHTLTLEYTDGGKATATFTITAAAQEEESGKSPKTGQGMDMMLIIIVLCLLSSSVIYFKKVRNI